MVQSALLTETQHAVVIFAGVRVTIHQAEQHSTMLGTGLIGQTVEKRPGFGAVTEQGQCGFRPDDQVAVPVHFSLLPVKLKRRLPHRRVPFQILRNVALD